MKDSGGVGRRKVIALCVGAVAVVLAAVGVTVALRSGGVDRVTLATATQPIGAVVCVAVEKGYFAEEGLEVTTQPYMSGKDALCAVLDGKADVCEVAETPVVFAVLEGKPVCIFASVAWSQKNMAIVGRVDRGIRKPEDMRGRRIGVSPRTNGDFFLHQFLAAHGLSTSDVEVVGVAPPDMVRTLAGGEIDGAATWNPHVANLQKALGTNAVLFHHTDYVWTWNLAAQPAYLEANPRIAKKILRAVGRAAEYVRRNPVEARAIVASRTKMDEALLAQIWDVFSFGLALENMLLDSLESQGAWAVQTHTAGAQPLTDLRRVIRAEPLKSLTPEAVTLRD